MNKYYFLLATSSLLLASCAEDLSSNQPEAPGANGQVAIDFSLRSDNMTRDGEASLSTEANDFGVWAFKGNEGQVASDFQAEANTVMENYLVGYNSATAWPAPDTQNLYGSSWWYENLGSADYNTTITGITKNSISNKENQYLKYWDLGKDCTAFFAYAPYVQNVPASEIETPTFVLNGNKGLLSFKSIVWMGSESPVFYAGRWEKNKDHADITAKVPMMFKRLTSQVEMAIYEAVPGYHVRMLSVDYEKSDLSTVKLDAAAIPADYNAAATPKYKRGGLIFGGKPVVEFDLTEIGGTNLQDMTGSVSYVDARKHGRENDEFLEFKYPVEGLIKRLASEAEATFISDNNTTPSKSPTVYHVIPNDGTSITMSNHAYHSGQTAVNSGIQVVMNFELVADDTGEVITVKNARAYVGPDYTKWQSNKKYTYVFKITKDVTGTTTDTPPTVNPDDPAKALYPIVFDDVKVETIKEGTPTGNDHIL